MVEEGDGGRTPGGQILRIEPVDYGQGMGRCRYPLLRFQSSQAPNLYCYVCPSWGVRREPHPVQPCSRCGSSTCGEGTIGALPLLGSGEVCDGISGAQMVTVSPQTGGLVLVSKTEITTQNRVVRIWDAEVWKPETVMPSLPSKGPSQGEQ